MDRFVGHRCRIHFASGQTRVGEVLGYEPAGLFSLEVEVEGPTVRSGTKRMFVRLAQIAAIEVLR